MATASPRPRIVPTGPESFVDELLSIDRDFFGGCCPACEHDAPHPIDESEQEEVDGMVLVPVLVPR